MAKTKKIKEVYSFDFEALYIQYPNREGKRKGMEKLEKTITTPELYERFKGAMLNYIDLCHRTDRVTRGFVKQWCTFVNNWTDYEVPIETKTTNLSLMEMIEKGDL